jgi:hypothetical protein
MLVLVIPNNPNTKTPVTNALVYVLKFVPACMGVNPTLYYGHKILMTNLLIFIAEPNAVNSIRWDWMWSMFLAVKYR